MSSESIDHWLARLDTLIRGLDLVEPGTLPHSFSADIVDPLSAEEGMVERLRNMVKVFELTRDLTMLGKKARGRIWFFWSNLTRLAAEAAKAEQCVVWRLAPNRVLVRIHPLSGDDQVEEGEWPKGETALLTSIQQTGFLQTRLVRLGPIEGHPIVLQFQSKTVAPIISSGFLEQLAEYGAVLSDLCRKFLPSWSPKGPHVLTFGEGIERELVDTSEGEEEGSDWNVIKTGDIYGSDPKMLAALDSVKHAAESQATVYFRGESGTGKELFARHLHNLSDRKDGPFIPINCSAVPRELIESEMFGHEKGSFTGAYYRKIGKVEQAHGGTLFLDEIGEMPLAFQAKLLRYLQEHRFTRVGGNKPIHSDARVVVATHRDLREMVTAGKFREDLYYRVHVIPIDIPPLRERGKDVRKLSRIFFRKYISKSRASRRQVDERVFEVLERFPFPGNVRELDNVIQRTVVMTQKPLIEIEDLPSEVFKDQSRVPREAYLVHPFEVYDSIIPENREDIKDLRREIEQIAAGYHRDLERRFLLKALEEAGGSARKAAAAIDVNRTLFYKLLRRSGINLALLNDDGPPEES